MGHGDAPCWPGARTAIIALLALAALATLPGPALAGSISLEAGVLSYRSAQGEIDAYRVALGQGYVEVARDFDSSRDPNGTLSAGPGCTELSPDPPLPAVVRCPLASAAAPPRLQIDLGDRSDHFTSAPALIGEFNGGRGRDTIAGAGNLNGGPRNDHLAGAGRNSVVRGGRGNDSLDSWRRAGPMRMFGGPGADSLTGSYGGDRLAGGSGNDTIRGSGGTDVIDPGPGVDSALGDAGADIVRARDGRLDAVNCWVGRDTVVLDRFDFFWGDPCERVRRDGAALSVLYGAAVYLKADGHDANELALAFTCPSDGPRVCDPSFTVSSRHGQVLAGRASTAAWCAPDWAAAECRGHGAGEWTWSVRPRALEELARWARVTMVARDALGRPYQQTIVCPAGATRVEFYEGESYSPMAQAETAHERGRSTQPLADSRTCWPPLLDPWSI